MLKNSGLPTVSDSQTCVPGTEKHWEIPGGFSPGIPTSRATVKPRAISFVSKCFNQILKML